MADETRDLDWFTHNDNSNCPATANLCRWSDANFSTIRSGIGYDRGFIANAKMTDTEIDTNPEQWRISSEGSGSVNDGVYKVGQKTGRTWGYISQICKTEEVPEDSGDYYLCQNEVTTLMTGGFPFADHGDSGGPVFSITDFPAMNDATLRGIVVAGHTAAGKTLFSPIGAIYMEIDQDEGSWATWNSCAPVLSC
ncbi:MAG: hypothetical protein WD848_02420 [Dehalococcoidia bacterium]